MVPARNAIDAHAQDFVMNDELLLPILQAFAQCTRSYALLEMLDVLSLHAVLQISVSPTNNSTANPPPPSQTHTVSFATHHTRHAHLPRGSFRGLRSVYLCMYMYYACMYVFMYACLYVYMHVCMCACMCVCLCRYVCVCMYVQIVDWLMNNEI
jgi:hypothetical protein